MQVSVVALAEISHKIRYQWSTLQSKAMLRNREELRICRGSIRQMKRQIRSKSIKTLCGIKLSQALPQSQISLVIHLESIPRRMCSRLIKILFIRKKPGMTHQNYEVIFQDQTLVIAQKFTLFLCKRAHNIFLVHLIRARRSLFKVR